MIDIRISEVAYDAIAPRDGEFWNLRLPREREVRRDGGELASPIRRAKVVFNYGFSCDFYEVSESRRLRLSEARPLSRPSLPSSPATRPPAVKTLFRQRLLPNRAGDFSVRAVAGGKRSTRDTCHRDTVAPFPEKDPSRGFAMVYTRAENFCRMK